MASQVVAAYMMVEALNNKGYNGFALSVPSFSELQHIYILAAPVFVLMMSKVLPAWLSCLPLKGDLIEAKVVHDQLCSMVERSDKELLGPNYQHTPKNSISGC